MVWSSVGCENRTGLSAVCVQVGCVLIKLAREHVVRGIHSDEFLRCKTHRRDRDTQQDRSSHHSLSVNTSSLYIRPCLEVSAEDPTAASSDGKGPRPRPDVSP